MEKTAKKGLPVALQIEVNTEEDWQEILKRPGLLVIDVYSDWSGPCVAMVSTLRRIKLEFAGDILSYAIARNDDISDLERFRGKSVPVWMFVQGGNMVNIMFGAHCPKLRKLLLNEIRRVQQNESPTWSIPITERSPDEEEMWQKEEAIREAIEAQKADIEEAERRVKYTRYLEQMMFELCEETALLLYPWVFFDEEGLPKDKDRCAPYSELKNELFLECFDIVEEIRIQLDDDIIKNMFVESNVEINDDLIAGLTMDKCIVMRLRGKPPHPSWPVSYPNERPKGVTKCPVRTINDVENYLMNIIDNEPPPLLSNNLLRRNFDEPYVQRHFYIHEPDPEMEEEVQRVYPAAWIPPQAKSKVHVFKTIFNSYMTRFHPYEEPAPPLPLCAFKYNASTFETFHEAYTKLENAIKYFGAFEFDRPLFAKRIASTPDDFQNKVKSKTGKEIFVIILTRISEEAFLSFAGIEPYFVSEDEEEINTMIQEYFEVSAHVPFGDEINVKDVEEKDWDEESDEMEEEENFYDLNEEEGFEYGVIENPR